MKGIIYLFLTFMLLSCGNTETATETTTTASGETTTTVTGEAAVEETSTSSETPTATQDANPFPEDEKMKLYCKKLLNKFIGGDYHTTTTEMYMDAIDQLGAPTFKGKKLKEAEIRKTNLNYTNKESTLKLAEIICNPVLPPNPVLLDYHPRGKNFFYDQGECGCVQVFVPSGGEAGGKAGGYALEDVFYYKKGKLVAVYDDKDQAVEMTEAHKTLSVENLTQFEAIKKIE